MYDFYATSHEDGDWDFETQEDFELEPGDGEMRHRIRFVDWKANQPFEDADAALSKFMDDFDLDDLIDEGRTVGAEVIPVRTEEAVLDFPEEFKWAPCNIAAHGNVGGVLWGVSVPEPVLEPHGAKMNGDDDDYYDEDGEYVGEYITHPPTYVLLSFDRVELPKGKKKGKEVREQMFAAACAVLGGEPTHIVNGDSQMMAWSFYNDTHEIYLIEDALKAAKSAHKESL